MGMHGVEIFAAGNDSVVVCDESELNQANRI
jgi:hypothetical protein